MRATDALNSTETISERMAREGEGNQHAVLKAAPSMSVVASSLLFSVLQSICTAIVALNSVRLAIGVGSLAMTTGLGATMQHFHQITWLRVTLLVGALSGSLLTLGIVLRATRLRNRPAARWRLRPLSNKQRRKELLQLSLSFVTLLLVVIAEYLHYKLCHTL